MSVVWEHTTSISLYLHQSAVSLNLFPLSMNSLLLSFTVDLFFSRLLYMSCYSKLGLKFIVLIQILFAFSPSIHTNLYLFIKVYFLLYVRLIVFEVNVFRLIWVLQLCSYILRVCVSGCCLLVVNNRYTLFPLRNETGSSLL